MGVQGLMKCDKCSKEMIYGEVDIHSCLTEEGEQKDLCSNCHSKHTIDTNEITNLIIN